MGALKTSKIAFLDSESMEGGGKNLENLPFLTQKVERK